MAVARHSSLIEARPASALRNRLTRHMFALGALALLAACSETPPLLPPDAPGIIKTRKYAFGDAIAVQDNRAIFAVMDELEPRFGKKTLRPFTRVLEPGHSREELQAYYRSKLEPLGWKELPLAKSYWNSWSFALESAHGGYVLALVALTPNVAASNGTVPLTILTNLDDDGNPHTR